MRRPSLARDFVPITSFKSHAAEFLRRTAEGPVVVTQNGRPAGVLISPSDFDALTERQRFREAVERGLADAAAGRVVSDAEVTAHFRRRRR